MRLIKLGWNSFFQHHFDQLKSRDLIPARIAQQHKNQYLIYTGDGELHAGVSGKLRHETSGHAGFPAVGDWVAVTARPEEDRAVIHCILPRAGKFTRKAVLAGGMPDAGGKTEEQVLAANIDTVFLVSGLDGDYNLRRIERYMTVAWDSGAAPVIVLNKTDLCAKVESVIEDIKSAIVGVPVLKVSAVDGQGLELLRDYLVEGKTAAFLGSSGVGKSTIINGLLGYERQRTNEVRERDDRGVHTTTYRELILLPTGGMVVDTPGLREIQAWTDEGGLSRTFSDIEALAEQCRFNDCRHEHEPGCAVRAAIESGELDEKRYQGYLKLQKETRQLSLRQDKKARRLNDKEWGKKINRVQKDKKELRKKGLI